MVTTPFPTSSTATSDDERLDPMVDDRLAPSSGTHTGSRQWMTQLIKTGQDGVPRFQFYDADGNLDLTKIPTAPASLTTELVHYVVLCCIGVANSGKNALLRLLLGINFESSDSITTKDVDMGVGMLDGAKNMAIIALDVEGVDAIQSQSDETRPAIIKDGQAEYERARDQSIAQRIALEQQHREALNAAAQRELEAQKVVEATQSALREAQEQLARLEEEKTAVTIRERMHPQDGWYKIPHGHEFTIMRNLESSVSVMVVNYSGESDDVLRGLINACDRGMRFPDLQVQPPTVDRVAHWVRGAFAGVVGGPMVVFNEGMNRLIDAFNKNHDCVVAHTGMALNEPGSMVVGEVVGSRQMFLVDQERLGTTTHYEMGCKVQRVG